MIKIMIKKFNEFGKVNEKKHLDGDYEGMKDYIVDNLRDPDDFHGFLEDMDMDDLTSLYHKVEKWVETPFNPSTLINPQPKYPDSDESEEWDDRIGW